MEKSQQTSLTFLAVFSSITGVAFTGITVHAINTSTIWCTWFACTFVNIWGENIRWYKNICREEHLSCIINRTKYYSLRRSRRALAVENSSTKPISCDTCRGWKVRLSRKFWLILEQQEKFLRRQVKKLSIKITSLAKYFADIVFKIFSCYHESVET